MAKPAQEISVNTNQIMSQFVRRLPQVSFVANSVVSAEIPRDDVVKRIYLRLTGSQQVTFGSGSPFLGGMCFFQRLFNNIQVVQNGQDTIKSLDPHLMRMANLLAFGQAPERAYTKQAGAFSTRLAQTELSSDGVAFQATTGYMLLNESLIIPFEHVMCYEAGRGVSLWNTKGLSSAEIRFACGAMTQLQEEPQAATVTYTDDLPFNVDVELITVPWIPREKDFLLYKQAARRVQYSAQVSDSLIDLPRGNRISGIHILVRDGDTNRRLSDKAVTSLSLLINGQRIIQRTTFITAQQQMRMAMGVYSPKGASAAGVTHNMQGYCYLGFLEGGDARTALDVSIAAGVDLVQLQVTTAASSGVDPATYTNPVEVTIMTDEIAPPVARF